MGYNVKVFLIILFVTIILLVLLVIWDRSTQLAAGGEWKLYRKGNRKRFFLVIGIVAVILCCVKYNTDKEMKKILLHKGMAIATITDYQHEAARQSDKFRWVTIIYGNSYSAGCNARIWPHGGGENFVGKKFPLMYDSTDITNHYILIFPEDFERVGMKFPDSLKWVIPYNQ